MSAAREPWWSSGVGPDDPPLEEQEDPIGAHRAARRGDLGEGEAAADERSSSTSGENGAEGDAGPVGGQGPADGQGPAHTADICGVCPICLGARLLGETRPELLSHLTEAARHLAAAARTLLDDDAREDPSPQDADAPVTRIDLD